jgi:peptide-methionine (R)-S-oxide reductase
MDLSRRKIIQLGAGVGTAALFWSFSGAASAETFPFTLTDAEWRKRLSPEAYATLRQNATDRPFSNPLNYEHRAGIFACAGCEQHLFSSKTKFESHTGWPSFWAPLKGAVGTRPDYDLGVRRTEVHCSRCGGHLGHVFHDGPKPTGLRYCMDGTALHFIPAKA